MFIQPDKVQGPNRYAYVNNNPITFNDPTGNCVQCDVWWMREYVTGDHPWQAQSFSSNPSLATLGHVDTWSGGIPSLLVGMDMQDNALDTMLSDSKQYVSKSEAEAAFMVNMGIMAVGGAQGLAKLEGVGAGGAKSNLLAQFWADEKGSILPDQQLSLAFRTAARDGRRRYIFDTSNLERSPESIRQIAQEGHLRLGEYETITTEMMLREGYLSMKGRPGIFVPDYGPHILASSWDDERRVQGFIRGFGSDDPQRGILVLSNGMPDPAIYQDPKLWWYNGPFNGADVYGVRASEVGDWVLHRFQASTSGRGADRMSIWKSDEIWKLE